MLGEANRQGLLVVLSAPSGCGKGTVLAELNAQMPIKCSVSMTTRAIRPDETDGVNYYFVSEEYFLKKLNEGQILEYTNYNGNYYGTPKAAVDDGLRKGETVILEIEVEGAGNIRRMYPDSVGIFLVPPSMQVLEDRLRKRGSETEEEIQSRLTIARNEMKQATEYDYIVVNDRLEEAVEDMKAIIRSEKHRTMRSKSIISEVINNA